MVNINIIGELEMGLFNKMENIIKLIDNAKNCVEYFEKFTMNKSSTEFAETVSIDNEPKNMQIEEDIVLAPSSHTVEEEVYGDDDSKYLISFKVNDAFKEAKSHAGEVEMLNTNAPIEEYGEEGTFPYLAIQLDDEVYNAVEEFKENGTFTGAIEITTLTKKFYFKAKMEYYEYMMYFYGMDRCDGFWKNNGLCIVYPKVYVGTENEIKLMNVLDEVAESYREERRM